MLLKFFLSGEVLHKKTSDLVLLRCINKEEADYMIKEVHSGIYELHMNGHFLTKKIMRTGYFCLTMEHDYIDFVRKYIKFQMYCDVISSYKTI